MRRPCLFKERDVTRAAKAVLAAGLEITRVEIGKDGTIVVLPAKVSRNSTSENDLDRELAEFEGKHGQD